MEQDNKISTDVLQNKDIISSFNFDSNFVFIFKKTEKLVSAIYLITNLFSDSEPMKWDLRKKSTEFLSFTLEYKNTSVSTKSQFENSFKNKVLEIVSMLKIASISGLISESNFSILEQEFLTLLKKTEKQIDDEKTSNGFTKSFFFVEEKPEIKSQNYEKNGSMSYINPDIKNTQNHIKDKQESKKTTRQENIINLLKKKSDITIKDIAQFVRGCSEKTIQRELILLISLGIVKKIGERRWSRYSLINMV